MKLNDWGSDRAGDLVALCSQSLQDEELSVDELTAVLWEDPSDAVASIVLGSDEAAVAAVARRSRSGIVGFVRLVAVAPDLQRNGLGTQLVKEAESWLADRGAGAVALGGDSPIYLWPGVDARWVGVQCLAESCGYRVSGSEVNMSLPSSFRTAPPSGIVVRRLVDEADVSAVRDLVVSRWPDWVLEFDVSVDSATAHGAFEDGARPVGFCAHSVQRFGWLGPMATAAEARGRGVGAALVSAVCEDLSAAGCHEVEICWVGPVRFYAKLGASMSRCFRSYHRSLG